MVGKTGALVAVVLAIGLSACVTEKQQYDPRPVTPVGQNPGVPPSLAAMQALEGKPVEPGEGVALNQRMGEIRNVALAFGAQGGLAHRAYQLQKELEDKAGYMSRIYDFNALAIPMSAGGFVVPPVIEEANDAFTVASDGMSASSAQRVLRIIQPARIMHNVPDWRTYLTREWEQPRVPTGLALPRNAEEKAVWQTSVAEGWAAGITQADRIFEVDINRLVRDHAGMMRYRSLVASGVVKDLYLAQADLGVTGGGDEMRIGERMVRITTPVLLNGQPGQWSPIVVDMEKAP